ncbi:MAG: GNAT family N-acetyltransferase [Candidatus Hydrogenedentota bacterium]
MRIRAIVEPPENFPEFIHDVAEGLTQLYGNAAGEAYRRIAPKSVAATMRAREVRTYCAEVSKEPAGMAMVVFREGRGRIPFIHVLRPHWGTGVESLLVHEAVKTLRKRGVDSIASECIPFCDVELRKPFEELGFQVFPRQLMIVDTHLLSHLGVGVAHSAPCTAFEMAGAAEAIAAAYDGHPERALHPDVQDAASAEAYIRSSLQGAYGLSHPEYVRVVRGHDRVLGVIVGCEVAPGVGFVLQLAVRPDAQKRGLGRVLIQDLATCFLKRGMNRTALGVTLSNPARHLYLRLGFEPLRNVAAFVWMRP